MRVRVLPGKYIVAVSGGVDSISLLHILSRRPALELVVAHFNHGIRPDSGLDEALVRSTAERLGLKTAFGYGNLGPAASEGRARQARYEFLERVKLEHQARAIITAHHQDDLIETAFLNLLRGSGRRGLSSIADSKIVRPLLNVPKTEIRRYALEHKLDWREDSTNKDDKYLRNRLRKTLAGLDSRDKKQMLITLEKVAKINKELNQRIATLSHSLKDDELIDRAKFIDLPEAVNSELVMHWLREAGELQFNRETINRLNTAIKTARPSTRHDVSAKLRLEVGQKNVHFTTTPTPKT